MKFVPKSEDKRDFFKLKDSESILGVFRGAPYEFKQHWQNNRSILCPQTDKCELCKSGDKARFRFRLNFVTKNLEGKYHALVFEQGWNVYGALRELNLEYPLEHFIVKITRHGADKMTKYTILPLANGKLNDEQETNISAVLLNDLGHITEAEKEPHDVVSAEPSKPTITDEDIPF